jgi:hypothetical protein
MTLNSNPRTARRRAIATAVSALAVGATMAGATAGVAGAHPLGQLQRLPRALTANRVLVTVETGNDPQASRTTQLSYVNPSTGVRYFDMDQYGNSGRNYIDWEKDTPKGADHRSVKQIDVDPPHQIWSLQTATLKALPAPDLGIQSTGQQVTDAIQGGKAKVTGATGRGGDEIVSLASFKGQTGDVLYITAHTHQPVEERQLIKSGKYTFTTISYYEKATPVALSRVETAPKIPSGYTKSS